MIVHSELLYDVETLFRRGGSVSRGIKSHKEPRSVLANAGCEQ